VIAAAVGAAVVLAARWLLDTPAVQSFVAEFPGTYDPPAGAPVGSPGWLGWQHFFNVFLMVLIIRSGIMFRRERKPPLMWAWAGVRRSSPGRKISITLWFHQSLDLLWLINGIVFVILLFVTGQWMRIVPTSWVAFPNALTALLRYIALEWPADNGWVAYNALQQFSYFAVVFVAAPLAAVTGLRMSGLWPADARVLNRLVPSTWARRVHFPIMIFFVAFIVVHVTLVFATGALRNLDHMYASRGATDPEAFAGDWTGFWFFVVSVAVIAAASALARPSLLAPVARVFGVVSKR
jgi:thiosulfate reductase cytochrome b subunit